VALSLVSLLLLCGFSLHRLMLFQCYFPLYCIPIMSGKRPNDSKSAVPARTHKKIDLEQKMKVLKEVQR
jgi:hypothetical protein